MVGLAFAQSRFFYSFFFILFFPLTGTCLIQINLLIKFKLNLESEVIRVQNIPLDAFTLVNYEHPQRAHKHAPRSRTGPKQKQIKLLAINQHHDNRDLDS